MEKRKPSGTGNRNKFHLSKSHGYGTGIDKQQMSGSEEAKKSQMITRIDCASLICGHWTKLCATPLVEITGHEWWLYLQEVLGFMTKWVLLTKEKGVKGATTSAYTVKELRDITRKTMAVTFYHPDAWGCENTKRKEVFDIARIQLYGWDSTIPFKHVNSGRNRAVKEELLIMIDYLLSRTQEEILPYLVLQQDTKDLILSEVQDTACRYQNELELQHMQMWTEWLQSTMGITLHINLDGEDKQIMFDRVTVNEAEPKKPSSKRSTFGTLEICGDQLSATDEEARQSKVVDSKNDLDPGYHDNDIQDENLCSRQMQESADLSAVMVYVVNDSLEKGCTATDLKFESDWPTETTDVSMPDAVLQLEESWEGMDETVDTSSVDNHISMIPDHNYSARNGEVHKPDSAGVASQELCGELNAESDLMTSMFDIEAVSYLDSRGPVIKNDIWMGCGNSFV